MTDELKIAGWIVHTDEAIYGTGKTREKALADARKFLDHDGATDPESDEGIDLSPATEALIAEVVLRGGAIAWGDADGIACTTEEADEAEAA